jgi:hypothetical protein
MIKSLTTIAAVGLSLSLSTFQADSAGRGGGPAGGPGMRGANAPTFSEGRKVGFVNGQPPGWSRGKKKGWGCKPGTRGCVPPGLQSRYNWR